MEWGGDFAEPGATECVPTGILRRDARLPAADIKPVLRPAEADIEQAAIFLQFAPAHHLSLGSVDRDGEFGPRTPQRQRLSLSPQQCIRRFRQLHRIRQDHDWGFEPLGAVHCQDADLVARPCPEIALDLGVAGNEPAQEALQ